MDQYHVCECRLTQELYDETRETYGTFVPLEKTIRIHHRTREKSVVVRAAFSGYIFVPIYNLPEMRRRTYSKYLLKPCYNPLTMMPQRVTRDELVRLQRALNDLWQCTTNAPKPEAEEPFKVGDKVQCPDHPLFVGQTMVVARIKPETQRARVEVSGKFVEVPLGLLQKI